MITLKTKQSLGNSKSVHFHVDQFQEDHKQPQQIQHTRVNKSRRVKSMVMFDDSDDSDLEDKKKPK